MNVSITQNNDQTALPIDSDGVRRFCIEILDFFQISTNEVILHFISEEKTQLLHGLFFGDTSTTDCMSFPIDGKSPCSTENTHTLGECFINPNAAISYDPENPYEELSRYIVHCILHCVGHCDKTANEKSAMRALEDQALAHAKEKKVLLSNPHPLYT